ncbi:putative capsular polysaccharide synthesis family protein, partial [Limnospira platensis]
IWEKCIKLRPDLSEFYYQKACCLEKMGNSQQAIQCLHQLLKSHPEHQPAKSFLNTLIKKYQSSSPLPHQNQQQRFLVYTMGKVGSTSISTSLKNHSSQVYDIHFLEETYLQKNMHKGHCIDGYFVLKNWLGEPLKIISLVRNPIAVNISGFFQNLDTYYPHLSPEQILQLSIEELINKFWTLDLNYPLIWFDREFKKCLNFDIYSQPFSLLGWQTYLHESYHILIMQAELMDSQKQEVIRMFTGISNFHLENQNLSSQKWYSHLFKEFKEKLVLPGDYLDKMLNSQFTKHFYRPSQIQEFYKF